MRPLCIKTLSTCQKHSGHWNHGQDCKGNGVQDKKGLNTLHSLKKFCISLFPNVSNGFDHRMIYNLLGAVLNSLTLSVRRGKTMFNKLSQSNFDASFKSIVDIRITIYYLQFLYESFFKKKSRCNVLTVLVVLV